MFPNAAMTKRPPFIVIILVVILCFVLGILNVFIRDPEAPTPASDTPLPTEIAVTDSPIQSILIIGVDDLRNLKPKLRAIWVAAYRSSEKIIYLHALSLDTPLPEDPTTTLQDNFSYAPQSGPGVEFLDGIHDVLPLDPTLTMVLDDIAFAELVDYLGGIEVQGNALDGESVLTFLSLHWDQPKLLLQNQASIVRALIPKALDQPESPELTDLFSLVPSHAFLSMDISTTVAMLYPLREINPDSVFLIMPEDAETP
jgi:hypothetical protein